MTDKDQNIIDGLVEKVQYGSTEAFGQLYDIFLSDIYRFIYYKVTQKELAEDLTEDTFFKMWQNINQYQKTKYPFSSWLYRIAHNTVIDYLRKEKIQIEEIVEEIQDERMNTSELANGFCNQQVLQKALSTLPEMQREVIILKYVNELENKEIATVIDKSETAVRILLSRGLNTLKDNLSSMKIDI